MNNRKIVGVALGLVFMLAAGTSAFAASVSAWEVTNPNSFSNGSWAFGDIFTVGGSNIVVTSLGAYDADGNGFASIGGIPVGLYRESDGALLASSTVLSTDPLSGHYRFSDIGDITLSANTQYRVVAVSEIDFYNIATGTPDTVDSSIAWDRYGYCATTSLTRCDGFTGTERTWMANFQITDSSTNVPEPATFVLLGISLAGLSLKRRK